MPIDSETHTHRHDDTQTYTYTHTDTHTYVHTHILSHTHTHNTLLIGKAGLGYAGWMWPVNSSPSPVATSPHRHQPPLDFHSIPRHHSQVRILPFMILDNKKKAERFKSLVFRLLQNAFGSKGWMERLSVWSWAWSPSQHLASPDPFLL